MQEVFSCYKPNGFLQNTNGGILLHSKILGITCASDFCQFQQQSLCSLCTYMVSHNHYPLSICAFLCGSLCTSLCVQLRCLLVQVQAYVKWSLLLQACFCSLNLGYYCCCFWHMISLDCGLTLWFQSLFHRNQIFLTEKLVLKVSWNFRADCSTWNMGRFLLPSFAWVFWADH
jgi:hypothetical protein